MLRRTFLSNLIVASALAIVLLAPMRTVDARGDKLPHMPAAALLVGSAPSNLLLSTEEKVMKLQTDSWWGTQVSPSLSADGRVLASARFIAATQPRTRPRLTIGTYSLTEKRWTDYPNLEIYRGPVAISRDGSKLACVCDRRETATANPRRDVLSVLDLRTGTITVSRELSEYEGTGISWSPDGQRIVFDRESRGWPEANAPEPPRTIYVLNLETGIVSSIGHGASPAWSPSGEWIAFLDDSPDRGILGSAHERVNLMRPDGSDLKGKVTMQPLENLNAMPVWSPDSRTILVNELRDPDKGTHDTYMLDVATLKLTRKFKDTSPVYAWIEAK